MATYDQIMQALRNAHAAGDTASAQRLARMAQSSRQGALTANPQAGQDPRVDLPASGMPPARPAAAPGAVPNDIPPDMASTMASLLTREGQAARMAADAPEWSLAGRQAAGEGVVPMDPTRPPPMNPEGREWLQRTAQAARANLMGDDDPTTQNAGEKIAEWLNRAGESLTLGLVGDEAAAGLDAAMGRGTYEERLASRREQERLFQREHPVAALAADIAPAFLPGLGAARFAAGGATRGAQIGRAAGAGFAAGSTYGFMEGEGGLEERARNAAFTGTAGAAFGAALPAVAGALQGLPRHVGRLFGAAAQRPTVDMLKAAKNAAYGLVERSGHLFSPQELQGLVQNVRSAFQARHYVDDVDTAARASLRTLENQANGSLTLSQLDSIRQSLWNRYNAAKDQPMILDAIHAIDGLIDSHAGASPIMAAARAANATFAKSQLLENALQRAADQTASTGSGGNILNKMRQAVTSIINDRNRARFFSDQEIEVMRRFVHGDGVENFLRRVGKLSPSGNGLMFVLHAYGAASMPATSIPIAAAGIAAKAGADGLARLRASNVQDMLAGAAAPAAVISRPAVALGVAATPTLENVQSSFRSRPLSRPQTIQGR